jgi:hypothetical protein
MAPLQPFALKPAPGRTPNGAKQRVQVVSLGNSCGVKLTIKAMGLDEESLPFDWARTSVDGLMQWLTQGFHSYLNGPFKRYEIVLRNAPMTVYRSNLHSFWHDDMEDAQTVEKLKRRINRFNELATDPKATPGRPLLFVRSLCGTNEISKTEALYQALQTRFGCRGRQVYLLAIIEDQGTKGPILHARNPNLMFTLQPITDGPLHMDDAKGPYEDAIEFACRRIMKDPTAMTLPGGGSIAQVQGVQEILGGECRSRGFRDSEAGLWCGRLQIKGVQGPQLFCAFEGYNQREGWVLPEDSSQLGHMGNSQGRQQTSKSYSGITQGQQLLAPPSMGYPRGQTPTPKSPIGNRQGQQAMSPRSMGNRSPCPPPSAPSTPSMGYRQLPTSKSSVGNRQGPQAMSPCSMGNSRGLPPTSKGYIGNSPGQQLRSSFYNTNFRAPARVPKPMAAPTMS